MSAYLKVNLFIVNVLYVPDDVYLVSFQFVADSQNEVERIVFITFRCVMQTVNQPIVFSLDQFELRIARKPVSFGMVFLSVNSESVVPYCTNNRKKYGRASAPVSFVTLPQVFPPILVLDTRQFSA